MKDEAMSLEDEIKARDEILLSLIRWANSGACSDCDMFNEAPSTQKWQHAYDCGHLEEINRALSLLGRPLQDGHYFKDAKAEMKLLLNEREEEWKAREKIKQ
jgi:hypothetical protein